MNTEEKTEKRIIKRFELVTHMRGDKEAPGLRDIFRSFLNIKENAPEGNWCYFVSKNLAKIEQELKKADNLIISKRTVPDKEMLDYNNEEQSLLVEYSEKDEKGSPIIDAKTGYKIQDDKEQEFEKKIEELGEKYPGAKKTIDTFNEERLKIWNDVADIQWYTIKKSHMPAGITPFQFIEIEWLVE